MKILKLIMSILKSIIFLPIGIAILIYRHTTRKAYYISGTFINQKGNRMFFKTVFLTWGNILPLYSIKINAEKKFNSDVLILNVFRIPYKMAKYTQEEYKEEIIFDEFNN